MLGNMKAICISQLFANAVPLSTRLLRKLLINTTILVGILIKPY